MELSGQLHLPTTLSPVFWGVGGILTQSRILGPPTPLIDCATLTCMFESCVYVFCLHLYMDYELSLRKQTVHHNYSLS